MKKTIVLIVGCMLLLSVGLLCASESGYEKHVAKGVMNLEEKNHDVAVEEFRAALVEKPDDAVATLYLGIALSRSYNTEAEAVLTKALSFDQKEPRTNLELGIYYYNRGSLDESRKYFNNTVKFAPNTEFSAKADDYLKMLGGSGGQKPWSVNFSIGEQYDSNVVLGPEDGNLASNISRESDWRTVLYGKGKYNFFKDQSSEASASYSIYRSLHGRLDEFDVTQHLFALQGAYHISPLLSLQGIYSTEYVYVGGDDYDYSYSLAPSVMISEGNGLSTEIQYKYSHTRFMDSDVFETNSGRSGDDNLIGVTQRIPVNDFITAKAGYSYDESQTSEAAWDYRGNKFFAGCRINFPMNILVDVKGEYYNRQYDDAVDAADDNREDRVYTGGISATHTYNPNFSVTAGQNYTRNDSNNAAYDYKRSITSLFLNIKY